MVKTNTYKKNKPKSKVFDYNRFAMIGGCFVNKEIRKQLDIWNLEQKIKKINNVKSVIKNTYAKLLNLFENYQIEKQLKNKNYTLINRDLYWDLIEYLNENKTSNLYSLANVFENKLKKANEICDEVNGIYSLVLGLMYFYGYGLSTNKIYGEELIMKSALYNDTFGILYLVKIIESNQLSEYNFSLFFDICYKYKLIDVEFNNLNEFIFYIKNLNNDNKNKIIHKLYLNILLLGNIEGAYYLGHCYENSIGVEYDADKSRRFYKVARHFYPNL